MATYNPSKHTTSNKSYGVTAKPDGGRTYFLDDTFNKYRPYVSKAEVLEYLNTPEFRTGQFPIIINSGGTLNGDGTVTGGVNDIYYFRNGVADTDLVTMGKDQQVNSMTELRRLSPTSNGERAYMTGYYQPYDLGAGTFYWDATSTQAYDKGQIITLVDADGNEITTPGRWVRMVQGRYTLPEYYGAKGDGTTNDTDAIKACFKNNFAVLFSDSKTYLYSETGIISNVLNLSITGNGILLLAPGTQLEFADCPNMEVNMTALGNVLIKSHVTNVTPIDASNVQITVGDSVGTDDNYSRFSVGDGIQTFRNVGTNAIRSRTFKGDITAIAGNVFTVNLDSSLGGSIASIAAGQEIFALQSTVTYAGITYRRCDNIRVSGRYEVGTNLNNCQNIRVGDLKTKNAGVGVTYCYMGVVDSVVSEQALFYGFGMFKSRNIRVNSIVSDNCLLGGMVCKNNVDSVFQSIIIRRACVYGAQFRDDTGTPGVNLNPNLQSYLNYSYNLTISSINLVDCTRGIWIDGQVLNTYYGSCKIQGTVQGASVLYEAARLGAAANVHFGDLMIVDHFIHETPATTTNSNAPIRIAEGKQLQIDRLTMMNNQHANRLITTEGTSTTGGITVLSGYIADNNGVMAFNGTEDVCFQNVVIKNPKVSSVVMTFSSTDRVLVDNCKFIAEDPTKVMSRGIDIGSDAKNLKITRNIFSGYFNEAAVYVDPVNGEDIQVTENTLNLLAASYGITCRGSMTKLKVVENDIVVPSGSVPLHTSTLTATDYRIEAKAIIWQGAFAANATLAAGAEEVINIPATNISSSSSYIPDLAINGSKQQLQYSVEVQTTNNIRVTRRNPTASAVNAGARTCTVRMTRIIPLPTA